MEHLFSYITVDVFNYFLIAMIAIAVIVFVALYFIKAGYGMFVSKKWGICINNKTAWALMEMPVFLLMMLLWAFSSRRWETAPLVFLLFFQSHYFRRAFLFPFLLKGKSRMPLSIMFMGITFNLCNAFAQGGWIFYFSPADYYTSDWFTSPQFIIGTIIFYGGMLININSDQIIRNLRKPGDTNYYFPKGGMFKYVTSAHYFGEIIEWIGFAILTWSIPGLVFVIWTMANLVPRSNAIYNKYKLMFPEEMKSKKIKRIFPYIY